MMLLIDPLSGVKMSLPLLCMTCVLLMMPENSRAMEWNDLWQTPDQQAQKAFQQQQYEQAAGQFEQSEWKAAAQYKTGQYQQVLDTLQDVHTSEGFYNRGNAYVKQGQLQEALEAYEKSLEIDPENADAEYNKELIEKELEKQKQQNQQQEQDDSQKQEQEQQDKSDSQNKDGEQGDQSEGSQDQKESEENRGENQPDADHNDSETKPEQGKNQQQERDESAEDADSTEPYEEETEEDEAEASAVDQANAPKDESEQASEQWLKRIPDDPAGLLKKKFEYQYKQRGKDSRGQHEKW